MSHLWICKCLVRSACCKIEDKTKKSHSSFFFIVQNQEWLSNGHYCYFGFILKSWDRSNMKVISIKVIYNYADVYMRLKIIIKTCALYLMFLLPFNCVLHDSAGSFIPQTNDMKRFEWITTFLFQITNKYLDIVNDAFAKLVTLERLEMARAERQRRTAKAATVLLQFKEHPTEGITVLGEDEVNIFSINFVLTILKIYLLIVYFLTPLYSTKISCNRIEHSEQKFHYD